MKSHVVWPAAAILMLTAFTGCQEEPPAEETQESSYAPAPASPSSIETEPSLEEQGRRIGEEAGEFADAVKDEVKDVKNEVRDFFEEGQGSAQHRLNERLEAMDEQLEDLRKDMDELGDRADAKARESWDALEKKRAELEAQFKELQSATGDTVADVTSRIETRMKEIGDALEAFAEEFKG